MHPEQLSGLPDPVELKPDGLVDLRCPKELRANRISKGPESFADHLLGLSHLGPEDGLSLFRRLPKETPSRESRPHRRACSFAAGVFVHGGIVGLRRTCSEFPASVKVFAKLIRSVCRTSASHRSPSTRTSQPRPMSTRATQLGNRI